MPAEAQADNPFLRKGRKFTVIPGQWKTHLPVAINSLLELLSPISPNASQAPDLRKLGTGPYLEHGPKSYKW